MRNSVGSLVIGMMLTACSGGPEVCYLEKAGMSVSGPLGETTCKDLDDELEAFRRAFDGQTQLDERFSGAWEPAQ